MLLELSFIVRHACLEHLHLVEQGKHDRPDGGGGSLPVRQGNSEGRRKLAHRESMNQRNRAVRLCDRSRLTQERPEGLRVDDQVLSPVCGSTAARLCTAPEGNVSGYRPSDTCSSSMGRRCSRPAGCRTTAGWWSERSAHHGQRWCSRYCRNPVPLCRRHRATAGAGGDPDRAVWGSNMDQPAVVEPGSQPAGFPPVSGPGALAISRQRIGLGGARRWRVASLHYPGLSVHSLHAVPSPSVAGHLFTR